MLRTDWTLPAGRKVVHAEAHATGVGAMELHINGKKVGDHIMDPGQTPTDMRVLYVTFDVTELLRPGHNAVGALLGNGKFGYLDIYANRTREHDQSGDATRALLLSVKATLDDASTHTLLTNTSSWSARHGPIIYDHMWHGEIFDSRLVLPLWDSAPLPSFPTSARWRPTRHMAPIVGRLTPQSMEPIRIVETLAPITATRRAGQAPQMWYDFGSNIAGFTSLTFQPPSIDKAGLALEAAEPHSSDGSSVVLMLRVTHAEIADESGKPNNYYYPGMETTLPGGRSATCSMQDWYHHMWYECANQTTAYIFELPESDADPISYTPTFTYHGFQFATLTASRLLSNGSEVPLPASLAASFPWGAQLQARRAHSDLRRLAHMDMHMDAGDDVARASPAEGASSSSSLSPPLKPSEVLGRIFNATVSSHVAQLWSIPTDCPQREKRGWMGDAGLTASSLNSLYDALAFHSNFLRLIVDEQAKGCWNAAWPVAQMYKPNPHVQLGPCRSPDANVSAKDYYHGSVPDVVPFMTGPYGGNPGTVDWQAAFVSVAHATLKHHGSAAVPMLREIWPNLAALLAYFDRRADPSSGLLLSGARGDWVPPASQRVPTPKALVAAFVHTVSLSHMADIATALGLKREFATYSARLRSNQVAFDRHFRVINATRTRRRSGGSVSEAEAGETEAAPCCYGSGSQASNLLALHAGAVPREMLNQTLAALVASFGAGAVMVAEASSSSSSSSTATAAATRAASPHLDVGIFGTTYVFDVLRAHDLDDLGLETLAGTSYPSFGHMVVEGATTLWEGWEGTRTEHAASGTSRNHIMFGGGCARFLLASVGGLDTWRPRLPSDVAATPRLTHGWETMHVKIAPWAMRHIGGAHAVRATPRGPVRVAWHSQMRAAAEGSKALLLRLNLSLPSDTNGMVDVALIDGASRVRIHKRGAASSCVLTCGRPSAAESPEHIVDHNDETCPQGGHYHHIGCRRVPSLSAPATIHHDKGSSSSRYLRVHVTVDGEHAFTAE